MPRLSAVVLLAALAAPASARPADLLAKVPAEATLAVVVEHPRKLVEALRTLDAYRSAQALPAVREALDSTQLRRFFQFIAYYEQELGAKWPDLLDKLAGRGLVLGAAVGAGSGEQDPVLLVADGTDEATAAEFYALALKLFEQELARSAEADAPKLRRATHNGIETVHAGKEFHAARVGATLLVSNREVALHRGLDQLAAKSRDKSLAAKPGPLAARKLLGGDPLAWVWFDFAKVKEQKAVKDFFEATRKDAFQTIVLGGNIDAFRRADFIAAGLHATPAGLAATLRLPSKRADLPAALALHAPPAGTPGSLPLLEPPGVLYSQSFYLDLGHLWTARKTIFNDQQLKDIEKAEKDISKVLPGTTFGKLLEASGPYHRVVAVGRADKPYKTEPGQPVPPFAVVSSMRDPQFGKTATAALRGAGFLASVQAGLKLSEETHDGVAIVSYRFPEDKPFPGDADPDRVRFNFVPSFAVVGDSLVTASSPAVIKALIPELRKPPAAGSPAVWRAKGYAAGGADFLRSFPDPTVTRSILSENVGLDEAKKRTAQLADWVATLGAVELSLDHQAEAYQIRLEWKQKN
ncbi:MAG: hypothetical protein U0871_00340 [Gemmataceae bacterium]